VRDANPAEDSLHPGGISGARSQGRVQERILQRRNLRYVRCQPKAWPDWHAVEPSDRAAPPGKELRGAQLRDAHSRLAASLHIPGPQR